MKFKKSFACGCIAAFVVLVAAFMVGAADQAATKAADVITIKAGLWTSHTKAPVEFSHKKHAEEYKIACTDCHHKFENGKNVWKQGDPVQKCEACHNEPTIQGEKKLPPEQQKLNLKLAFHENCVGCHQKLKKDKPDTKAPVTCTGCHPAQK
jgi:hypothetical protein